MRTRIRILARLRTLRSDLIDPTIAVHHGRIVKRTGDGSIIEFRSVVDAVNCAIEVQRAMVERNAEVTPDKRIEFRIGIHLGDVVEESDGDLMGDGVNIAARLEGICEPGGICLSDDAYRQVKGRLDLAVSDLGPTQLKNIAEPIRVYSLRVGVPARAKPAKPTALALPKNRLALVPLASGIAALLIVLAGGAWWFLGANRPSSVASSAAPLHLSIVVLPFANLSGDPAQDYLADSLTDELTTALARIPDSFVIARNTAFTYKGKPVDAKAIGKDLGVRYVLEGSVQPSGSQVSVNAQLIDADSGAHLWADQFDTPRADLLQTQDEIVTRLGRAMNVRLTEAEAARLKRTQAANPDAEDLALRCTAAVRKGGFSARKRTPATLSANRRSPLIPTMPAPCLGCPPSSGRGSPIGRSADPKDDLKRADELASKVLALDPNYAIAHYDKAEILSSQGRHEESIAEAERALALDPTAMEAYSILGWDYWWNGQFEKSLEAIDTAIRRSPFDRALGDWYHLKAAANYALKQYDRNIEFARRAIAINPTNFWPHGNLIGGLALTGHQPEAREALQNYLASVPGGPKTIAAFKAITAQFVRTDSNPRLLEAFDRYFEGLRKAGLPEE